MSVMTSPNPHEHPVTWTRRELLQRIGTGFGALAFGSLMSESTAIAGRSSGSNSLSPLASKAPHFAPKAKRVVHLFMNGGPSHVDTFDPKPALTRYHGRTLPIDNLRTERKTGAALGSPFRFRPRGQSGIPISDLFEHVGDCADDLCVIRSMQADVPNHEPSLMLMNCGDARQVRPSLGSWTLYGLGTENQNLPGFIVMCPNGYPIAETQNWQSGFLPGIFQGTYIDSSKSRLEELIAHIQNDRIALPQQRAQLDLLQALNRRHAERRANEAVLESRIESFELAFRMQSEASDAFDIEREPESVRELYGPGVHARQLLMTRRLLERGVRFVQLWHGQSQPWDHHDNLAEGHRRLANQCDRSIAAFLKDLKRVGLLDETLVIWGGEFGRTPTVELPQAGANQGKMNGRDHNHYGFTMWLAGGGVKGGHIHGSTDEFGFRAVEDKVHVHDLHATILHLLGFDHEKLTYRYAGRDFRLTDVHGHVVHDIIA